MDDDKVDSPSHDPGTRKGEEVSSDDEAGREETGTTGAGRPTGKSEARDSTSINPQNPIDEDSPEILTP
jgi:hypothetical protein